MGLFKAHTHTHIHIDHKANPESGQVHSPPGDEGMAHVGDAFSVLSKPTKQFFPIGKSDAQRKL